MSRTALKLCFQIQFAPLHIGEVHEPFDPTRPLSVANERAALKRLAMAATNILFAYPTTEAEDLDMLLEDPDLAAEEDEDEDEDFGDDWETAADAAATAAAAAAASEDAATVSDGDDFDTKGTAEDAAAAAAAAADDDDDETGAGEWERERRHMPRRLRVPGGLVQSAVALRLREKRLLKSAVRWLARREATLDELRYQAGERLRPITRPTLNAQPESARVRSKV